MKHAQIVAIQLLAVAILLFSASNTEAYSQYAGSCDTCHGDFTGGTSPTGNTFPGDDKHQMHRANGEMNTDCALCHTSTGDNPMIGSSAGTANNTGYGCVGCHGRLEDAGNDGISAGLGAGLRQHHYNAGFTGCAGCHSDANPVNYTPVGEDVEPPYYGVAADSNVAMSCNPTQVSGANENWTIGDFTGLDNDGDLMYDAAADGDCVPPIPTPGDLNFDGMADILWRNSSTGQNWVYLMNGAAIDQSQGINTVVGAAWEIVGNGDYDGDGDADVLWRNSSTGQNWMYVMNGAAIESSAGVNTVASASWNVVGNGDYDGDGNSDILWRNSSTGQNWMYLMDGASIIGGGAVVTVADNNWMIVGSGDHDGDGRSDILWRNSSTGQNWLFLMNGTTRIGDLGINTVANLDWQIAGTGDYNGDSRADILWRNSSTGQNWMYLMNGATIDSGLGVNTVSDTNWQIVGGGDHNGDGNADILWRNSSTGQNWVYLMTGATIDSSLGVNTVSDTAWQVVNTN